MDHREIGQQQELFLFSPLSPGSPVWLPKGLAVWDALHEKVRELNREFNYQEVRTPVLWKSELYKTSGHLDHFRNSMYLLEDGEYALKPMNCPSHMLVFQSKRRSYKEMPFRIADQSLLHRNETSGAIGGLTRCRSFCQDDGHCFVTEEGLDAEVSSLIEMVGRVYRGLGLSFRAVLSTRPDKVMGDKQTWDRAEAILSSRLKAASVDFTFDWGGGAYYGPKIDFLVRDSQSREWQTATVQLDFQLPARFRLEYVDEKDARKTPVVVHRAFYGSFERFIAILLEHHQGALPDWMSPVQVRVLPVSRKFEKYARLVAGKLGGLRVEVDADNATLPAKIAVAVEQKIPYVVVVGKREESAKSLSVRDRAGKQSELPLDKAEEFVAKFAFRF